VGIEIACGNGRKLSRKCRLAPLDTVACGSSANGMKTVHRILSSVTEPVGASQSRFSMCLGQCVIFLQLLQFASRAALEAHRGTAATIDGNDNVWVSNFAMPNSPITQLCGVRTENCPPGFKTGDQISPPCGYVGGGLQMQTDLAVSPGEAWVMNNWQDIDSCLEVPDEALSTRCGGQRVS
jgi:hypothetical protein